MLEEETEATLPIDEETDVLTTEEMPAGSSTVSSRASAVVEEVQS